MRVGYVRCSTIGQNEARQMKMMKAHKKIQFPQGAGFIENGAGRNVRGKAKRTDRTRGLQKGGERASPFPSESRTYSFSNTSLPRPQVGQVQSSGTCSQGVPGATPLSGSPTAGS